MMRAGVGPSPLAETMQAGRAERSAWNFSGHSNLGLAPVQVLRTSVPSSQHRLNP